MTNTCTNPQCQIDETGHCLDGFENVSECPTYNAVQETASEQANEVPPQQAENDSEDNNLNLTGQLTLESENIDALLKKYGGHIVACIGPKDVGKTTLYASLYDLFQEGSVGQWHFGSSTTIYPFEQLCHLARASSNRVTPGTRRTSRLDGLSFYHFALYNETHPRIDLYLADRAGEVYSDAADSATVCADLLEVSRADTILLLVDAENLISPSKKHLVKRQIRSIVEAFATENMLDRVTQVIVTLTKYDLAVAEEKESEVATEHNNILSSVKDILGSKITVTSQVIAARPTSAETSEPGQGLPGLLDRLILNPPPKAVMHVDKPSLPTRTFLDPEFGV